MNPTNSEPIADATNELEIGQVQWHCSEEGGGPDVGILLRIDDKHLLWWGELLADESSESFGAVIYGPDGERQVFDTAYDEIRQVFEDYVAPALRTRKSEALADEFRARVLVDGVKPGFNAVVDGPDGWPVCHCGNVETAKSIALALNALRTRKSEGLTDDAVEQVLAHVADGGPHEWGYRDPVTGDFIADDWPFKAADALAAFSPADDLLREAREAWKSILASMKRYGMESTAIETVDDYFDAALAGEKNDAR